jgi:hypothetical protein
MLNQTEYSIYDSQLGSDDFTLKKMELMLRAEKSLNAQKAIAVLIKSYLLKEIAIAWKNGGLIYLPLDVRENKNAV